MILQRDVTELAQATRALLRAVWEYDKEQPVQSRLQRKHDAMREAMELAKAAVVVVEEAADYPA